MTSETDLPEGGGLASLAHSLETDQEETLDPVLLEAERKRFEQWQQTLEGLHKKRPHISSRRVHNG